MTARRKRMRLRGKLEEVDNRQNDVRDWAGLPEGLLEVVLERLPLVDCLSFSNVCKSWRIVATKLFQGRTCGIPWLIKPGQKDNIRRSCFSIAQDLGYEVELPEACGKYIWGSFQDWLVVVKQFGIPFIKICLLNPFSGAKIDLPKTFDLYRMMVLSTVPTDENCLFVLVGINTGRLAFWTRGALGWHELQLDSYLFVDALSCKGCFYLLDRDYRIVIINIEHILSVMSRKDVAAEIKTQLLPVKIPDRAMPRVVKRYLVESCGEILLVCQLFSTGSNVLQTCGFETFRLDLCRMKWVKLESLEDRILFVGKCCSRSFHAKELGDGMANCIYFTNNGPTMSFNEWGFASVFLRDSDVDDWGIFNLQSKVFSNCGKPKNWAAIWITAPMWWYFRNTCC